VIEMSCFVGSQCKFYSVVVVSVLFMTMDVSLQ